MGRISTKTLRVQYTEDRRSGWSESSLQSPILELFVKFHDSVIGGLRRMYYTSANKVLRGSEADRKLEIFLAGFSPVEASLRSRHIPSAGRKVEILPLRKPDQLDYTEARAYRPISLLPTLVKALESMVVERLSYLTEVYSLLPKNHFTVRKSRSMV